MFDGGLFAGTGRLGPAGFPCLILRSSMGEVLRIDVEGRRKKQGDCVEVRIE